MCEVLKDLLNYNNINMDSKDVTICALEIFKDNNLDFVDCLLCCYCKLKNWEIITFDEKLKKCIEEKAE